MDGKKAVEIARKTIELWVNEKKRYEPKDYPKSFNEKSGVFVTIYTYPEKNLRGCIGFPEPVYPLIKALIDSAISATQDPRFEPLNKEELNKIIIEVSILTKPELIRVDNPKDYVKEIRIGRDGLIIRRGFFSGLLLPQVATEYGWNAEEFLSQTCVKAGLTPDVWLDDETKVYKFQSLIFSEDKPPSSGAKP